MADVSIIAANGVDYNIKDATARSGLTTANSNITTLQSNMTTAQSNISSLQSSMSTANGKISTLESKVASMIEGGAGYCKMSDGTMLQWGTVNITSGTFTQYASSPFYIFVASITFPKSFYGTATIVSGSSRFSTGAEFGIGQGATSSGAVSVRCMDISARVMSASEKLVIKWMAVGRWKA